MDGRTVADRSDFGDAVRKQEVSFSKSTGEEIPSDEVAMLVRDLTQALADLTANSFSAVRVSLD